MSALYNDGTVQYGSRAWYILQSDGTSLRDADPYVMDNITINRATKSIDRTNQLGEPSGSVGIADFVTGSATAQLGDGTMQEPRLGDRIFCTEVLNPVPASGLNVQLDTGGVGIAERFYITSVTRNETRDAEKKFNLTFKKQYVV